MPLTVQSLGSGSSGNALLLDAGAGPIAVDCGIGPRALAAGLAGFGYRLADLQAVLLTHEHADHIRALPAVQKTRLPVLCTAGTASAAGVQRARWEEVRIGTAIHVGGFNATALRVSHDAADPCCYYIEAPGGRVLVATDLGSPDAALREYVAAADLIVLEANHDEQMLRSGPYPAYLKQRVLSSVGHLSNADCGDLLRAALAGNARPRTVWLAHLSQTNNRPELARRTVAARLAAAGQAHAVEPLARTRPGSVWRSDQIPTVAVQLALSL